ncbi:restriction endonuclease [Streptomyces rhizosphaericola]|uniref:restriction endonuclease n=1 Tax=Streptomyces rhizosphaericola TaxID=2564098 RepID=UPI003BF5012E
MGINWADFADRVMMASFPLTSPEALTCTDLLGLLDGEEFDSVFGEDDDDRKREYRQKRLIQALRDNIESRRVRRVVSPLSESRFAPGSFVSTLVDGPDTDEGQRRDRAKWRILPAMMKSLYLLTPREFEILCGAVLARLGCCDVFVTQAQKDDGVDVLAGLPVVIDESQPDRASLAPLYRVVGSISFLVYGQAKKYAINHKVQQDEVFEVHGSWGTLKNDFFDGRLAEERSSALRKLGFRSATPVLLIMMTTSLFTRGAQAKAESAGMITLDGEQMAQLLVELGLGVVESDPFVYETSISHLRLALGVP